MKDGQNYRSRLDGSALYLDAIASDGKISGQFAGCEFHRAGAGPSDWVGMCTEIGGTGEALRKLPATLNRFSEDRIEGSTGDVPVFVMTPVDNCADGRQRFTNVGGANTVPGASPLAGADPAALATPGNSPPLEIPHQYRTAPQATAQIQTRTSAQPPQCKTRPSLTYPV